MKRVLFLIIITTLFTCNSIAQTFNREELIGQITQDAILSNEELDLEEVIYSIAEEKNVDVTIAEAAIYTVLYEFLYPEIYELYAPLSNEDLIDFFAFCETDVYQKLEGEKMTSTIEQIMSNDMLKYMTSIATGVPYQCTLQKIKDQEFENLANQYIDALGLTDITKDIIAMMAPQEEMDAGTKQVWDMTMQHVSKMLPTYYKSALYNIVNVDELKSAIKVYSRIDMTDIIKNAVIWISELLTKITIQEDLLYNQAISLVDAMENVNDRTGAREKYIAYLIATNQYVDEKTYKNDIFETQQVIEEKAYKDEVFEIKQVAIEEEEEEEVYMVVEEMPEFPGGMAKLMQYFSENVQYPVEAAENGIQGRVICQFTVWKDGSIRDVVVMRGVDKALDREAIRLIESMPNWIPGKQRGKAVCCKYTVPVSFRLN